ncbi:MAG: A/G-specific adenine glycosylase [Pseudomonadota bacterium]|nr:A/G-specific adenine glycosylase [Pseudomonadota bacterium]
MNDLSNNFASSIISWQEKFGRHHLPWQHSGAYATWISEIMLQQTQVITVIDYYNKFMSRFPTIKHLAQANIDDVLALWSGLGYYARARNIHKSAKLMATLHNYQIPKSLDELTSLPGIGPSTAGAIMALGHLNYGIILDGNVKRILSRCFGQHVDGQSSYGQKQLWHISKLVTPSEACHTYTQGIMDLGASVCHKHLPQCPKCPVQNICYAFNSHTTSHLPYKKPKKVKPILHKHMLIPVNKGKIGLVKNANKGIWGGLWTPLMMDKPYQNIKILRTYHTIKHIFTHQTWFIVPIVFENQMQNIEHWFSIEDALQLGLPKPVRDIIEIIQHEQINSLQETE